MDLKKLKLIIYDYKHTKILNTVLKRLLQNIENI